MSGKPRNPSLYPSVATFRSHPQSFIHGLLALTFKIPSSEKASDWVPVQTAMPESQLLSLDLSFPICEMEVGVEGVLQLLTITAIEITSAAKPQGPASPLLRVFSMRGPALSPGGPPPPRHLLRKFRKHERPGCPQT